MYLTIHAKRVLTTAQIIKQVSEIFSKIADEMGGCALSALLAIPFEILEGIISNSGINKRR